LFGKGRRTTARRSRGTQAELISTNLSAEQEAALRDAFEGAEEQAQRA